MYTNDCLSTVREPAVILLLAISNTMVNSLAKGYSVAGIWETVIRTVVYVCISTTACLSIVKESVVIFLLPISNCQHAR